MKKRLYITLACAVLLAGCSRDDGPDAAKPSEPVRVRLSGALLHNGSATRAAGEGMIDPIDDPSLLYPGNPGSGLPPKQLGIGIFTIEQILAGQTPTVKDWAKDEYIPYLDNGFFGGNIPGDAPGNMLSGGAWNGNIEYTNRERTAIQNVVYDDLKTYYYFVCLYPYEAMVVNLDPDDPEEPIMDNMLDEDEGATVYFEIDGSQDIMATGVGFGNIDHPFNRAGNPEELVFSHKLTALRCKVVAESALAATLYGDIVKIELINQPDTVGLNIGKQALDTTTPLTPESEPTAAYSAVQEDPDGNPVTVPLPVPLPAAYGLADAVDFGYILAMPEQGTYTFRITTATRNGLNTVNDVRYTDFATGTPAAGTIYNLTFNLLESAEINVSAAQAVDWWLDQTFD